MKVLKESNDLYKGIFWIVDLDNIYNNIDYCFQIPCDSDGNAYDRSGLTAKSGDTHNHEKYWNMLSSRMTKNKLFDYYPRGRAEISNGKATIYLNPNINTEEIRDLIISQYHLNKYNDIDKIRFMSDFSNHYRCYLDR